MRLLATDLHLHLGQTVFIQGWVHACRSLGKVAFLIIKDRSGLIQVVIEDKSLVAEAEKWQPGTVCSVWGQLQISSCSMGCEIVRPRIEILSKVEEALPIDYYRPKMQAEIEHILDYRPLSLRNQEVAAVFKIQAELTHAFRLYMHDRVKAVEYFAPCILGASSEGGSEFFQLDYFGYPATLAQSSQLYKQMMVGVYERVFALMPFFRAEPSQTTRHLSEGKQFEFEMGFFSSWHELLDVQEGCIKFIVHHLEKECRAELDLLGNPLAKAPIGVAFPRLTFKEAQQLFYDRSGVDERNEPDLSPRAEKELCAWALEKHGTDFVFVIDWLESKRPFYAYPSDEMNGLTNTMDLLCAGTEISSGGQRRHTYESMCQGLVSKGMNPENFEDYLSIFKYGMPPHGGFGMGLERLTMTLLGLKNIRHASLFPSDPKRIASVRIKKKIFFGEESVRNEIVRLCKDHGIDYKHLVNQKGGNRGVKSIIVRGNKTKQNWMFVLFSEDKIDMKQVAKIVGEKCEFEDPALILERYGIQVGGVPPFGHLLGIPTYYEEGLSIFEGEIDCAVALVNEEATIFLPDLLKIVQPEIAAFRKV